MTIAGPTALIKPLQMCCLIITPKLHLVRCTRTATPPKKVVKEQIFTASGKRIVKNVKLAGEVIKRQNWENDVLFGPLLKTSIQKRQDLQCDMVAFTPEAVAEVIPPGPVDAIPPGTDTCKIRTVEVGFRDVAASSSTKSHCTKGSISRPQKASTASPHTANKLCKSTENDTRNRFNATHRSDERTTMYRVGKDDTQNNNRLGAPSEGIKKLSELNAVPEKKKVVSAAQNGEKPTSLSEVWPVLEFPLINPWHLSPDGERDARLTLEELKRDTKYDEAAAVSFPSVTHILSKTMPEKSVLALQMWERLMIAKLGQKGFNDFKREMLEAGTSLHDSINNLLCGTPMTEVYVKPVNEGHWKSVKAVLEEVKNVVILEQKVVHPLLCYQGIVDCVAEYRNRRVVIDWKTSKKPKISLSSTYDSPVQAAAYVGALNFDTTHNIQVDSAMVAIVYESGRPADVHLIDAPKCQDYWNIWLSRLQLFREMTAE